MSKFQWNKLEKPLSKSVLTVVKNVLNFEKMTPVQVSIRQSKTFKVYENMLNLT